MADPAGVEHANLHRLSSGHAMQSQTGDGNGSNSTPGCLSSSLNDWSGPSSLDPASELRAGEPRPGLDGTETGTLAGELDDLQVGHGPELLPEVGYPPESGTITDAPIEDPQIMSTSICKGSMDVEGVHETGSNTADVEMDHVNPLHATAQYDPGGSNATPSSSSKGKEKQKTVHFVQPASDQELPFPAGSPCNQPATASLGAGDDGWEASADRPPVKLPIRLLDAVGRTFVFPWEKAKTWEVLRIHSLTTRRMPLITALLTPGSYAQSGVVVAILFTSLSFFLVIFPECLWSAMMKRNSTNCIAGYEILGRCVLPPC